MKIFMCHSSKDKKRVYKIKHDLDHKGFETLIDDEIIQYGDSIIGRIEEAIGKSNIVMCFLSNEFLLSEWVKEEWRQALVKQIEKGDKKVIPVFLEQVEPPGFLSGKKYLDLSNQETYDRNFSDFVNSTKITKEEKIDNYKLYWYYFKIFLHVLIIFIIGFSVGRYFPHDSLEEGNYEGTYKPRYNNGY